MLILLHFSKLQIRSKKELRIIFLDNSSHELDIFMYKNILLNSKINNYFYMNVNYMILNLKNYFNTNFEYFRP